jgi:hypothetical protein
MQATSYASDPYTNHYLYPFAASVMSAHDSEAPPPAYNEHSTSDTYTSPTSSTEDLLGDDHHYLGQTNDAYNSSTEELDDDDHDAHNVHPAQLFHADSKAISSTESLLANDYAEMSFGSKPNPAISSSANAAQKSKSRSTWRTIKKHTLEKPIVKDAAAAGYAGFLKGKKELERVNSYENTKATRAKTTEQKGMEVAAKYGKVMVAAALKGKKVFNDKQTRRKSKLGMVRVEDEYDVKKGEVK